MFCKNSPKELNQALFYGGKLDVAAVGVRRSSSAGARVFLRPNFRPETCVFLCVEMI